MEKIYCRGHGPIAPIFGTPKSVIQKVLEYKPKIKVLPAELYDAIKKLLSHDSMKYIWLKLEFYYPANDSTVGETFDFILRAYQERKSGVPLDTRWSYSARKQHFKQIQAQAKKLARSISKKYPFVFEFLQNEEKSFSNLQNTLLSLSEKAGQQPVDLSDHSIFPGAAKIRRISKRSAEQLEQQVFYRNLCVWFCKSHRQPLDEINAAISTLLFPDGKVLSADDVKKNTKGYRQFRGEDSPKK